MTEKSTTPTTPIELPAQTPEKTIPVTPDTTPAVQPVKSESTDANMKEETVTAAAEQPIERDYSGLTDVGYIAIIPINK